VSSTSDPIVDPTTDPMLEGQLDAHNDLGRLVQRGLTWAFAGTIVTRFGTMVAGLVLAHLLTPRQFGIYGVAAVALVVTSSVNDLGIEASLVRWPGDLDEVGPTAVTVVMLSSLLLFAAFWFTAPAFARAFNTPDGTGVVRLMAVGLIINGLFTVNSAVTNRTFRVHIRTAGETAATLVMIATTVVMAKTGFGAYSLAWGQIAGNVAIGVILFIWSPIHYRPGFNLAATKALLRSGSPIAGAGLLLVATQNVDTLIVGRELGAVALGLYVLSWNVSSWPITIFSGSVAKVSVAGFAKLQHDQAALNKAFTRSVGLVVAVTLPFCILLSVLSLPVVRTLYGQRWVEASTSLAYLSLMAALRAVTMIATDLLVACGRGRSALVVQAIWLGFLIPALIAGARSDGIAGVGLGQFLVAGCVVIPVFAWILARAHFSLRDMARSLARPLAGGCVIAAIAAGAAHLPAPDLVRLAVGGVCGLAIYAAVVRSLWLPALNAHRLRARQVP
jgi:PST family polysaccharide transporter